VIPCSDAAALRLDDGECIFNAASTNGTLRGVRATWRFGMLIDSYCDILLVTDPLALGLVVYDESLQSSWLLREWLPSSLLNSL
jgi:hypothetical protein